MTFRPAYIVSHSSSMIPFGKLYPRVLASAPKISHMRQATFGGYASFSVTIWSSSSFCSNLSARRPPPSSSASTKAHCRRRRISAGFSFLLIPRYDDRKENIRDEKQLWCTLGRRRSRFCECNTIGKKLCSLWGTINHYKHRHISRFAHL